MCWTAGFGGRESKVIVATGALGLGVDRSDIALVGHIDIPYGSIEFAHEVVALVELVSPLPAGF